MAMTEASAITDQPYHLNRLIALSLSLVLAACNGSDEEPVPPARMMPAGRLVQPEANGPITHVTEQGWRTRIEGGTVTIRPPEDVSNADIQYVAYRMRDQLGTHDLRAWAADRRTLLLPGGAKITMHGQAGEIMRLSLYDGAESHEVDVLTQTLMHSQVDTAVAEQRDAGEADGETGHLTTTRPWELMGDARRLHLANLYVQTAAADGTPLRRVVDVRALGRQSGVDLEQHIVPEAPAAAPDETCMVTGEPRGGLVQMTPAGLEYNSRSGLWNIKIDKHTITLTRSELFTWQVWGDPHENLNGKHIKDWLDTRRTLLLDDGVKVTMDSYGPLHVVHTTSIYDGEQSHQISNLDNVVRHSCVNAAVALARDAEEADGETAYLATLRGPAASIGYVYVENVYTESVGPQGVNEPEFEPVPLGETGDAETNPRQINDYFDDPRFGHT